MDAATALADAGFDIVHPFDAHACAREPGLAMLADPARPLGLLVGNTRALWPRIVARYRARPTEHPFHDYVEEACAPFDACWFSHRRYDGAFVPFQRLAVASGLGMLAPTQLVIHPTYGPWFALRAVVLVAGTPPATQPSPIACTCGAPCLDALAHAQAASGPDAWRAWLAVRESCNVGRNYRYSDDQIAYHYTKDRKRLC